MSGKEGKRSSKNRSLLLKFGRKWKQQWRDRGREYSKSRQNNWVKGKVGEKGHLHMVSDEYLLTVQLKNLELQLTLSAACCWMTLSWWIETACYPEQWRTHVLFWTHVMLDHIKVTLYFQNIQQLVELWGWNRTHVTLEQKRMGKACFLRGWRRPLT